MFFVKCAWKDARYCYCFSTFGPISMDCSQACKVFSSWRKQPFWMWLQELRAGARCSLQHKKLSSTWSFGWASSPLLLHGFLNKREGWGTDREQGWASCGVQIMSEIFGWTLFPRPPIVQHWSAVSVQSGEDSKHVLLLQSTYINPSSHSPCQWLRQGRSFLSTLHLHSSL